MIASPPQTADASLDEIIHQYTGSGDLLVLRLATDGSDCGRIQSLSYRDGTVLPPFLLYQTHRCSAQEQEEARITLESLGYNLTEHGEDVVAWRKWETDSDTPYYRACWLP